MPLHHGGPAPYAPAPAVTSVIERSRNGNLPTPVVPDVLMRIGVQESLAPRTAAALKLLELIGEDGQPTTSLEKLRVAKSPEFPGALAAWLKEVYAEVFGLLGDPASATLENVEDAFRGYTPGGQRARMVTLFIGLCDFAGLLPEDSSLRGSVRSTKRGPSRTSGPQAPRNSKGAKSRTKPETPEVSRSLGEFQPSPPPSTGQHPFIQGLLQTLPDTGTPWSQEKREAWLDAARAAFNVIYELPSTDKGT